jgi:hypothetical protein
MIRDEKAFCTLVYIVYSVHTGYSAYTVYSVYTVGYCYLRGIPRNPRCPVPQSPLIFPAQPQKNKHFSIYFTKFKVNKSKVCELIIYKQQKLTSESETLVPLWGEEWIPGTESGIE